LLLLNEWSLAALIWREGGLEGGKGRKGRKGSDE